ncbi:MAG: putative Ig domain-containing protein [Coriobacteriia bacterium]|nr:putative Ig domain-containing protein [Coriobacteriia bacterium]
MRSKTTGINQNIQRNALSMKRALSIALALFLTLSFLPAVPLAALADDTGQQGLDSTQGEQLLLSENDPDGSVEPGTIEGDDPTGLPEPELPVFGEPEGPPAANVEDEGSVNQGDDTALAHPAAEPLEEQPEAQEQHLAGELNAGDASNRKTREAELFAGQLEALSNGSSKVTPLSITSPTLTPNAWWNDYTRYYHSDPMWSFLTALPSGKLERVEWVRTANAYRLIVEEYSSAYKFLSGKEIATSTYRPSDHIAGQSILWGGFYSGASFNFVVTGQANDAESNSRTVLRVTKYTKDWRYLSNYELKGANTTTPFKGGSLRMTELGGNLYIRTAHEMYTHTDSYKHQSNMMVVVNQSSMQLVDAEYGVLNIAQSDWGYVSHSFNQFITYLGNTLYSLDHGDAYPRSAALKMVPRGPYVELLKFSGQIGANATFATLGGLETSSARQTVLAVGSSAKQSLVTTTANPWQLSHNVWLTVSTANLGTTTTIPITKHSDTGSVTVTTPQLVKINEDRFLIMWGENVQSVTAGSIANVNYVFIDGTGKKLSSVMRTTADLSDCEPCIINGRVVWYSSAGKALTSPVFYSINATTGAVPPKVATTAIPLSAGAGSTANFNAIQSKSFSFKLAATGTAPLSWVVNSGSLPPGLKLASNGTISGTPTKAGAYSFVVKVSNTEGSHTKTLTIRVAPPPPQKPTITSTTLAGGQVGASYKRTIAATGDKPITWTRSSGSLPPGLKLSSGGVISGTPTKAGTYTFTARAANAIGSTTKTLKIVVTQKPKITTTAALDNGAIGLHFKKTLVASGTKNISWKLTSGSLPPGLSLTSAGVISGKPTKIGTYTFTVRATNSIGHHAKTFTLKIVRPSISLSYSTHVQSVGWQPFVKEGEMSGTSGRALRLEGIKINVQNTTGVSGGIKYATHVQSIGWQKPVSLTSPGTRNSAAEGPMSGTSGRALRLEAITIELTGDLKKHYDIYYRVHAQSVGWMGWARNGEQAGTAGHAYRLEGIQILLVPKVGGKKPGDVYKGITTPQGAPRFVKK